jgi:signal transduction histidine kinase
MVTLLLIGAAAAAGHLDMYRVFIGYFLLCVTVDALRYVTKRALNFWHLLLLVFVYTNFIVWYTYTQIQVIKRDKYALVADNIALGEDSNFEVYVHKLLKEIETPLSSDETVLELLEQQKPSSQDRMMRYVTKSYFRDYWNNYDIKLFVTDTISEAAHRYDDDLKSGVLEPFTDHFYANRKQRNSYDFVGIFDYIMPDGAVKRLFLVLFKKSGMENYGYQDVLFEPETNRLSLLLSTAQYVNGEKVYSAGRYEYPDVLDAKNYLKDGNITYYNGYAHYIFPYGKDTYIIVGEQHPQKYWAYMLFFTYLFTIYLLVAVFFYIYWFRLNSNMTLKNTFLSQVQQSFITFVVLSLAVVFAISIIFIYGQYKTVQTQEQIDKTNYVRMALEEYWGHKSAHPGVYTADLNFFIQDLSQTYKTDIHVYNANGELLTTSRPYIFSKGLISKLMNPQVFFRSVNKEQVMSEHLGSLTYLTSYTEILNSNKERIGYISVPLFFSSQELSKELFTFLAIFINVYFVFLILAAVVSVLVSRRLSRPIKTIEQKLKAIKLGKRNEKIEYNHNSENDEIGTLINQYNLMVDELSESAQMLAQSERESAWREMARQIAHEIKNPLTPMKLTIQQLQRAKSLDEEAFNNYFEKSARILVEQIDSLSLIATEFSNFARIPVAHLVRVDIAAKLISVVDLFKNNYEEVDIVYLTTLDQVYIMADADQMTQLFNNLLRNAIQAIPSTQKGRVVVELDCDDEFVKISITDNGCGISEEVAGKLFTPNFTTKSSGMGLGLSIVKNIITVSQGEISFTTQVNVGTTFYVKFPLVK